MSRHVVWLRNDLRLEDNPALFHACQQGMAIVIYIATPKQWKKHDDAAIKQDFWRRNLELLANQLAELNIELRYFQVATYDDVAELIHTLCLDWKIDALFFNNEYPVYEQGRDQAVVASLSELDVMVNRYDDQLLLPPGSIRSQAGEAFKVFTPFSKVAKQRIPDQFNCLAAPSKQSPMTLEKHALQYDLDHLPWPEVDPQLQSYWPAGEAYAHKRLVNFCQQKINGYSTERDIPSSRGTSKLSAYLTSGVLSVRQCWQASVAYCEYNDGVRIWQSELLWREFYKHVLLDFPHVSKHLPWKRHTDAIAWRDDADDLRAWQQGETGFPLIDAAMKQLLQTGWMHNRLRMVTAMFLTKHLLIDWRLGEQWFMQHLIDGELAANNGGWQWSASTGTDAVPYFRIFNPITQSQRFDPQGIFIKQYLPYLSGLSAKDIHAPKAEQRQDYVEAIIDLKEGRTRALAAFKALKDN